MKDYSNLCGWIPPENRTDEQKESHSFAVRRMPKFTMFGQGDEPLPTKALLTDLWNSEEVQASLGFKFPGCHQMTGSCVGAGGLNVLFSTLIAEVLVAQIAHKIVVPFWLLPYGKSRSRAGMRGQGEGSLGSTFAEACRLDGMLDAADSDLPTYKNSDGLVWGRDAELKWSDGTAIGSDYLTRAKVNIVGTTAQLKNANDVKVALANWYACSVAVSHYCNPGSVKMSKDGLVLGQFDSRGGHQTSFQGYYLHPDLGDLFWYENNWGAVYPLDAITQRKTGCWVTSAQVDWCCRQEEVFAFSGISGFLARTFRWRW